MDSNLNDMVPIQHSKKIVDDVEDKYAQKLLADRLDKRLLRREEEEVRQLCTSSHR